LQTKEIIFSTFVSIVSTLLSLVEHLSVLLLPCYSATGRIHAEYQIDGSEVNVEEWFLLKYFSLLIAKEEAASVV
jgi:hypothetical protein